MSMYLSLEMPLERFRHTALGTRRNIHHPRKRRAICQQEFPAKHNVLCYIQSVWDKWDIQLGTAFYCLTSWIFPVCPAGQMGMHLWIAVCPRLSDISRWNLRVCRRSGETILQTSLLYANKLVITFPKN